MRVEEGSLGDVSGGASGARTDATQTPVIDYAETRRAIEAAGGETTEAGWALVQSFEVGEASPFNVTGQLRELGILDALLTDPHSHFSNPRSYQGVNGIAASSINSESAQVAVVREADGVAGVTLSVWTTDGQGRAVRAGIHAGGSTVRLPSANDHRATEAAVMNLVPSNVPDRGVKMSQLGPIIARLPKVSGRR
jgi:hypothetical protein